MTWIDAPHVPHGWDNGFLFEGETRTLFCGDLFTQAGHDNVPLSEGDLLGPAEAMRKGMDYYAHAPPRDARRARTPGCDQAADARLHARQRMAR